MKAEVAELFRNKKAQPQSLLAYGFVRRGEKLVLERPVLAGQFCLCLQVDAAGALSYEVLDAETGEPYALAKVPGAVGAFVGEVRRACLEVLREVAEQCFAEDPYRAQQTERILRFLREQCGVQPEYPWADEPSYAVFRHAGNRKWFAVLMGLDGSRVDPALTGRVEILNLKATPVQITEWVERGECYRGYHMNKLHWHTTVLDGHLSDETLFSRITQSFLMTK